MLCRAAGMSTAAPYMPNGSLLWNETFGSYEAGLPHPRTTWHGATRSECYLGPWLKLVLTKTGFVCGFLDEGFLPLTPCPAALYLWLDSRQKQLLFGYHTDKRMNKNIVHIRFVERKCPHWLRCYNLVWSLWRILIRLRCSYVLGDFLGRGTVSGGTVA